MINCNHGLMGQLVNVMPICVPWSSIQAVRPNYNTRVSLMALHASTLFTGLNDNFPEEGAERVA